MFVVNRRILIKLRCIIHSMVLKTIYDVFIAYELTIWKTPLPLVNNFENCTLVRHSKGQGAEEPGSGEGGVLGGRLLCGL